MSPQTAKMLEEEIYPIVKSVIPNKRIGSMGTIRCTVAGTAGF